MLFKYETFKLHGLISVELCYHLCPKQIELPSPSTKLRYLEPHHEVFTYCCVLEFLAKNLEKYDRCSHTESF